MDTLVVDPSAESSPHLTAVLRGRPFPKSPSVDGDDAGTDSQLFSAKAVNRLAVECRIRKDSIPLNPSSRSAKGGGEARSIVAGAVADMAAEPQVRTGVAHHRQLRPERTAKALGIGPLVEVVEACVSDLEPSRVNGSGRAVIDQAALAGGGEYSAEQSTESPFFSRRFSAFSSVVQ